MKIKHILYLLVGFDVAILFLNISKLSISYHEAQLLYGAPSFLQFLIKTSFAIFGQNDFSLRLPMILLHVGSILLLYKISKKYLKHEIDRIWLIGVFIFLPGVISSAIVVDSAGLTIFGLLLFVFVFEKNKPFLNYILLGFYIIANSGFLYLFFALIFFAYRQKDLKLLYFNVMAFFTSLYIYGFNTGGLPQGHFLDILGLYATIFTPIIFVYIFYALYRRYLNKQTDLLWFISASILLLSIALSFRQRIEIEQFAPYLIIAMPLAAQSFSNSYRVRLKPFRKKYKLAFNISLIFLLLNSLIVFFNQDLYLILDNPRQNFAYRLHVAKELSQKLKKMGIDCIDTSKSMQLRLKFYGIDKCKNYKLVKSKKYRHSNVTVSYKNIVLYSGSVTKVNINQN